MLTEPQFKVLMILFDDKGHAGWQLAEELHKAESNLNPYLRDLVKRKFIIQGDSRKSGKPKKREGDYKEVPYYLNTDINILVAVIKEMVVTNKAYDTGFPFRIIKTSEFIKSMRNIFKGDLNECLADLSNELYLPKACEIETEIKKEIKIPSEKRPADPLRTKDKRVSKKSLKELESWYESYLNKQREQESSGSDND